MHEKNYHMLTSRQNHYSCRVKCPDRRKTETLCRKVGKRVRKFLTKDHSILEIVNVYQVPFFPQLMQQTLPREIQLNLKVKSVVAEKIGDLFKNVAIEKLDMKKVSAKSLFVSNLFLVKKKNGGNSLPSI